MGAPVIALQMVGAWVRCDEHGRSQKCREQPEEYTQGVALSVSVSARERLVQFRLPEPLIMSFNWFDVALSLTILASVITGLKSGLARVVVGLISTIAGLLSGFWCYRMVGAKLQPYLSTPGIADVAGFLLIFFGVLLIGSLIAALLSKLFKWIGLSWFDHLLGGAAGFVRGILMVAGLAAILVAFAPSPLPSFLTESRVLPYASHVAAALAEAAPRDLRDSFLAQWENLKQRWRPRDGKSMGAVYRRAAEISC